MIISMIIEYRYGVIFKIVFTIRMYNFIRSYDEESQTLEDELDFDPFSEEEMVEIKEHNEKLVKDWDGGN